MGAPLLLTDHINHIGSILTTSRSLTRCGHQVVITGMELMELMERGSRRNGGSCCQRGGDIKTNGRALLSSQARKHRVRVCLRSSADNALHQWAVSRAELGATIAGQTGSDLTPSCHLSFPVSSYLHVRSGDGT